jgi:ferrous iron transport protein A
MGITPGATVILRKAAPMGDPLEINVRGYELSIRRSEAREITVEIQETSPRI